MVQQEPCILLVDEDPARARILQLVLVFSGYRVSVEPDLTHAAAAALLLPDIDLAILCVPDAGERAREVTLRLRVALGAAPLLALCPDAGVESLTAMLGAGCDAYLAIPVATSDVTALAQEMLQPGSLPVSVARATRWPRALRQRWRALLVQLRFGVNRGDRAAPARGRVPSLPPVRAANPGRAAQACCCCW